MRPVLFCICLLTVGSESARHFPTAPTRDALVDQGVGGVTTPVSSIDEVPVELTSGDATIRGTMYTAEGAGPHPAVLLLQGFPGPPAWHDMARTLQAAGHDVLFVNYRGLWASDGQYSLGNAVADAAAARAFLMSPATRARFGTAATPPAIVAKSLGGWIALRLAAETPERECVGVLTVADLAHIARGLDADSLRRAGMIASIGRAMGGERPILRAASAEAIVRELSERTAGESLTAIAPRLAGHTVFLLGATRDEVAPFASHHAALAAALRAVPGVRLTETQVESDHNLGAQGAAAIAAAADWMKSACR